MIFREFSREGLFSLKHPMSCLHTVTSYSSYVETSKIAIANKKFESEVLILCHPAPLVARVGYMKSASNFTHTHT